MSNTIPTVTAPTPTITVRRAVAGDSHTVLRLIEALAVYEKLSPPDAAARSRLIQDMFGTRPRLDAYLALYEGTPVGYALVLETYSSFLALPTLYVEDLFVMPSHRGLGAGSAIFRAMVREAERRGCGRMDWTVLDWNELALTFYNRMGAQEMSEWRLYRLDRSQFRAAKEDSQQ